MSQNWVLVDRRLSSSSSPTAEYLLESILAQSVKKPPMLVMDSLTRWRQFKPLAQEEPISADMPQIGLQRFDAARLGTLGQPGFDQHSVVVDWRSSLRALQLVLEELIGGGLIPKRNVRRQLNLGFGNGECPVLKGR